MKNRTFLVFLTFLFAFSTASLTSCSKKSGCLVKENVNNVKTGKDGQLSKKRGKSNLFPKDMRKKKGR